MLNNQVASPLPSPFQHKLPAVEERPEQVFGALGPVNRFRQIAQVLLAFALVGLSRNSSQSVPKAALRVRRSLGLVGKKFNGRAWRSGELASWRLVTPINASGD